MLNLIFFINILIFISSVQCAATKDNNLPKTAEIYHWAVNDNTPQPSILAKIAYDPETLESKVLSYTPPSVTAEDLYYRIGFFRNAPPAAEEDGSKQWVGSLVSQSALTTDQKQKNILQLYLGASQQHDLYHVTLSKGYTSDESSDESLDVEVIYPNSGALPELNKPVVLNPDGTNAQEAPEKSIFQQYWWVFLVVAMLALSSGGGGEGQQS